MPTIKIPAEHIPEIASKAEATIPGSGSAVRFILSNVDTITNFLGKAASLMPTEEIQNTAWSTKKQTTHTPTQSSSVESTIKNATNVAKSSQAKVLVHKGLELAANNSVAVTTAANSVVPGSGVAILPILQAYKIPGVKQMMNVFVDKLIDNQVDAHAKMAKTMFNMATSAPKIGGGPH